MTGSGVAEENRMRSSIAPLVVLGTGLAAACATAPAGPDPAESAITAAGYSACIATLASDVFEGRKPGQAGEEKTLAYLEREFAALGLKPGTPTGYRQPVPLVEITASPRATLSVAGAGGRAEFRYADDMVVWTKRVVPESRIEESPMVFVGYGIVAPEYRWNDYAGVDMHGKTAVILVNDPGFASKDPVLFRGRSMTYYGRWTYKFEEAMRQGAAAALIVHQTAPAAYGWDVVRNSNTGPLLDALSADGNAARVAIEGWVTQGSAEQIFRLAGQDFHTLEQAALRPGFKPLPLEARATVGVENAIRRTASANVVGVLPGTTRPGEYLIFMAHWDHFGKVMAAGAAGEVIFSGAVDNATGVAGILEIAKAFTHARRGPERSVVFLAMTGEESGLLGSAYYAANPLYPLAATAAAFNIDALAPYGRTRDVEVIGYGASELEDYLGQAAARQGRVLRPDSQPEKGFFFRSDHFNLAKRGVPALYIKTGVDSRDHPKGWAEEQVRDYIANRYHKPGDKYDPGWDVSGSVEDLRLLYAVGARVASESRWPTWYPSSEFGPVRERSRAAALR
jgi:Zn-dependent M28 family amino/carboxypeptidase